MLAHAPTTDPRNLATHCSGRRLDAILFCRVVWDIHPPVSADTVTFLHEGDHKGVMVTVTNPMGQRPPPPSVIGGVFHWPSSLFRKVTCHMTQWSKEHSTADDHRIHQLDRADTIIAAAASFVQSHPRPEPAQNPVEQHLVDDLRRNPSSARARQAWTSHKVAANMKRAQRHLRCRKCAVRGRSTFFSGGFTPFRMTSPQPDMTSAAGHLPNFAGDPLWQPKEAKDLLSRVPHPCPSITTDRPSWESFTQALCRPKIKAAEVDHVAPHLYQWLPRELQWDLYIGVCQVWESGDIPGMYSIVPRLLLDTVREPINAALSDPQAGSRRGDTTSQEALRMSMLLHQYGGCVPQDERWTPIAKKNSPFLWQHTTTEYRKSAM